MRLVEQALTGIPPPELFHYTSQEGLKGILETGEIWASKVGFMNDAVEFQLALNMARDILLEHVKREDNRDKCETLLEDIEDVRSVNVFVFSLSEEGDLLSQWRGYCPAGGGYSIGFSSVALRSVVEGSLSFQLGKCIYNELAQRETVDDLVSRAVSQESGSFSDLGIFADLSFQEVLVAMAQLLKHESFSEEREWRLISSPQPYTNPRFQHRPGRYNLIPYYRLPLWSPRGKVGIERIIIGPTPDPELSKDALYSLLGSLGVEGVAIERSEVPFRGW